MKKFIYLSLSAILGFLLSFLLHTLIEVSVVALLLKDFQKFSFGLDWNQLLLIHKIFTIILSLAGLIFGIWLGKKWWQYIYVDKKYTGKWFKIKK